MLWSSLSMQSPSSSVIAGIVIVCGVVDELTDGVIDTLVDGVTGAVIDILLDMLAVNGFVVEATVDGVVDDEDGNEETMLTAVDNDNVLRRR
ncbi:hypothetical protein NDU88_001695 [Pleurodeles waltl]|uniref:Uncharacterized protein n=1 Tax=Pleurodeles waltl TaxID=8319 RepID=A0AAV7UB03_PLEWA|nr:hypothetical protein NDU88_001695 [Pleurodeles waltl]